MNLSPLISIREILDENGLLTQETRVFFDTLYELVPRNGSGSPEFIVDAPAGATYYDLSASVGSRHYIKVFNAIDGDGRRGWQLA